MRAFFLPLNSAGLSLFFFCGLFVQIGMVEYVAAVFVLFDCLGLRISTENWPKLTVLCVLC